MSSSGPEAFPQIGADKESSCGAKAWGRVPGFEGKFQQSDLRTKSSVGKDSP